MGRRYLNDKWLAKMSSTKKPEKAKTVMKTNNVIQDIETCVENITGLFNCSICTDKLDEPTETQCGHLFCKKCLDAMCGQKNAKKKDLKCPLCNQPVSLRSFTERHDVTDMGKIASKIADYFAIERDRCSIETNESMLKKTGKKKTSATAVDKKEKVVKKKSQRTKKKEVEAVDLIKPVSKENVIEKNSLTINTGQNFKTSFENRTNYIIIGSGVEAAATTDEIEAPLDLSVERPRNFKYVEVKTAIKYITPLDLSNKRKIDESADNHVNEADKHSPNADQVLPPARKKGKFGDSVPMKTTDVLAKNFDEPNEKGVLDECDGIFDSVFTPTPTTPPPLKTPEEVQRKTDDFVFTPPPAPRQTQLAKGKKQVSSGKAGPGFTQIMDVPSSEIMRDFDQPFEEEDEQKQTGKWSGAETKTASDELLENIAVDTLCKGKLASQLKKTDTSKELENFVFKPPTATISQPPKKKADNKRKDDILMEWEDDFQQPRDSDMLFLNVSTGSGGAAGSDCEKENVTGTKSVTARNDSPVKTTIREKSQESSARSREMKGTPKNPTCEEVDDFDDDAADFLLDIPDPHQTPLSGKSARKEQSNSALLESPIAFKAKQKNVFCPTRLGKEQTHKLQQLCKMCDGTIKREFDQDVTHLVINLVNGRVPQTLKYLLAIAGRKWVVIYTWVEKCVEEGRVVSEAEYETSNFEQCDPGVKRSRLSKKNLFDGYNFYFSTEVYKVLGFTKKDVLMLMDLLGATIVTSADSRYRDLIIIGNFNGNSTEYNDWLFTNKWVTVTFDWVIECILEYRLKPFETKHLCVDASKVKSVNGPKAFKDAVSTYITQQSQLLSP